VNKFITACSVLLSISCQPVTNTPLQAFQKQVTPELQAEVVEFVRLNHNKTFPGCPVSRNDIRLVDFKTVLNEHAQLRYATVSICKWEINGCKPAVQYQTKLQRYRRELGADPKNYDIWIDRVYK
jgi:hypothetical protein